MSGKSLCQRLGHYYGHNRRVGTCQRCGAFKEHFHVKPVPSRYASSPGPWKAQTNRMGWAPSAGSLALALLGRDRRVIPPSRRALGDQEQR